LIENTIVEFGVAARAGHWHIAVFITEKRFTAPTAAAITVTVNVNKAWFHICYLHQSSVLFNLYHFEQIIYTGSIVCFIIKAANQLFHRIIFIFRRNKVGIGEFAFIVVNTATI
jgi:hypothetical protein